MSRSLRLFVIYLDILSAYLFHLIPRKSVSHVKITHPWIVEYDSFLLFFSEEKDLGISMENENSLGKQKMICAEECKNREFLARSRVELTVVSHDTTVMTGM
jgi:hypothetical protein